MKTALSAVAAAALLGAAATVPAVRNSAALAALSLAGLLVRATAAGWTRTLKLAVPVLFFAALLAGLQALAGAFSPALADRKSVV